MQAFLRGSRGAVVLTALLIGVCSLAAYAVEIAVLSTAKEEAPGSFVTHVFAVTNESATAETYLLAFEAPPGWGVLGAPSSITVDAGGEETLFVTLTIPPGELAGEYDVALTAASQDDPALTATSVARVVVTPTREIELLPPTGTSVAPGGNVEYEFVLINRGNAQDSFSIATSSSKRLPAILSLTAVDLAPQERAVVRVRLDVPADTTPGRDVLTVSASSTLHDGVEADAVVFTTILPPGPERVGGTLMEVLPARIRLSLDKNVFSGEFSSRLTFSTSGQIKGGFFSSNVSLSDPLGPDQLELGSFSILYRRRPTTYVIGNVSQGLTDLIRLSCRGGSVVIDEELFDLLVIGGGSSDETRFAGRLVLGPEEVNVGLAYLGIRDPTPTYQSVWSATASAEPFEDWTIRIEGALGIDGSLSSRAFLFNTEITTSGFFFSGTAFSVGTHFPGSRADSAGIELSHRLRLSALSLSVSLQHAWDNVIGDPLATTLIQDNLGFNLRTTPLQDGPTLGSTIEFTWDRYPNLSLKNETDTLFAVSLTETDGVFPYTVSGKIIGQIDHVLGTHVRRSTFSEGAGLSVDSFYLFLQLTQEKQVDLVNDLVLSSSSDVSLRFRPEGSRHEASIAFGNTLDAFDLSASLYIRFVEGLDIVFDGSISWDRVDSSSVSFGWGISLNADVEIPMPFFVTKGQVEGRAFIDRDGDGTYGVADRPLGGIIVAADGGEASTNDDGLFRFTPFYPGVYTLTVRQLPVGATTGDPIGVELVAGRTVWVDIPLAPVVAVTGKLFDDRNQDGIADTDEGGFAQVRALLSDETGVVADAYTDLIGGYSFPDVVPGRYTIAFDAATLPDRFVFTTAQEAAIDVAADAPPSIFLGGFIRPREVIVTFQPPTADFVYAPESPVAAEPITFDGTFSFDFDGQIVIYEWDFDADGVTDATEAVAGYTFPEPGTYDISLTVVDDGGNADTITLPIEVLGEAGGATRPIDVSTFQPPIADFAFMPASPTAGETVQFDGTLSVDFDGDVVSYAWDFDADGVTDATEAVARYTFPEPGTYNVSLTVVDDGGNADIMTLPIEVLGEAGGATRPIDVSTFQPPIADFAFMPASPTAGEMVQFDGTLSVDFDGDVVSYAWDFDGDGTIDATGPIATYLFRESGTYTVSLTVTDDSGNTDTISVSIEIGGGFDGDVGNEPPVGLPVAGFRQSPAEPIAGEPALFNGTSSLDPGGRIVGFAWDFDNDGQADSTAPLAEHTFAEAGQYTVSLTVTDDDGNVDSIATAIAVGPPPEDEDDGPSSFRPPVANFAYMPASPNPGDAVLFDGTFSSDFDGDIVSFAWDFDGDGTIDSTDGIAEHAFTTPGTYSVSLTVSDDGGNADRATRTIDVE